MTKERKPEGIIDASELDLYALRPYMLVDGDFDTETCLDEDAEERTMREEFEIPQGVTFGGCLLLNDARLKKIGPNVTVMGPCSLFGSEVAEIGDWFSVEKNLTVRFSQLKELPNQLHVGGDLYINDTDIETLPAGLHVKGNVYTNAICLIVEEGVIVEGKIISE